MNSDEIRERISLKGRKIVNVFPGPGMNSLITASVPKNVDVQFELFSESEIGLVESRLLDVDIAVKDSCTSRRRN